MQTSDMRQGGFSYIGLLLMVAMTSGGLAVAASVASVQGQREKEADLLFAGAQFRDAITAYRDRSPAGQPPRFPQSLQDLLEDRRWPTVRRHLKQVWVDPMTGTREWGLVRAPGGGIMGVHSLSEARPLKQAGFAKAFEHFAGAARYQEWRFVYTAHPGEQN